MEIVKFNEDYKIVIKAIAYTEAGLFNFQGSSKDDKSTLLIDYHQLMDEQNNIAYKVIDVETEEEVFEVKTHNDMEAVKQIKKEFDLKGLSFDY